MDLDNLKPKVIVVCGPTASGKTAFAIELAEALNGEIISADSMQVYRYMDIGTAKPTAEERLRIPHHMIDVVDPDEPFDAEKYTAMARGAIAGTRTRNLIPFVAGGTGLYIKALVHGLFQLPPMDTEIRVQLKAEAEALGIHSLYQRLTRLDPESAARIHRNDTYRILRALEVYELTGRPLSEFQHTHRFGDSPFDVLKIGLRMEREILYQRIDRRVDAMVDAGLVEEVKGLLDRGYTADLKSMQSIGYRHMGDYLQGRTPWDEAVRTLKRDTRRFAKRQMTWFRADPDIIWMNPEHITSASRLVRKFLNKTAPCGKCPGP